MAKTASAPRPKLHPRAAYHLRTRVQTSGTHRKIVLVPLGSPKATNSLDLGPENSKFQLKLVMAKTAPAPRPKLHPRAAFHLRTRVQTPGTHRKIVLAPPGSPKAVRLLDFRFFSLRSGDFLLLFYRETTFFTVIFAAERQFFYYYFRRGAAIFYYYFRRRRSDVFLLLFSPRSGVFLLLFLPRSGVFLLLFFPPVGLKPPFRPM